jgi:hypothetical protein
LQFEAAIGVHIELEVLDVGWRCNFVSSGEFFVFYLRLQLFSAPQLLEERFGLEFEFGLF